MSNIKNIVKVMNFHSLMRIDNAKKKAENYVKVEQKLEEIICQILYNRNLNIDKKVIMANKNGIILNIYIGNDLGFCGNFNNLVLKELRKDDESYKIIIGKKMYLESKNVLLSVSKEEFYKNPGQIDSILMKYMEEEKIKEVNIIFNHYYKVSDIRFEKKQIFPVQFTKDKNLDYNVDYIIETDAKKLLCSIFSLYLCYELKILEANSWASENVNRERVTRESIKEIEELEEEKKKIMRKLEKEKAFQKQLSNYRTGGDIFECR